MPTDIRPYTPAQSFPDVPPGGGAVNDWTETDVTFNESQYVAGVLSMFQFLPGLTQFQAHVQYNVQYSGNQRHIMGIGQLENVTDIPPANLRGYPSAPFNQAAMNLQNPQGLPGAWIMHFEGAQSTSYSGEWAINTLVNVPAAAIAHLNTYNVTNTEPNSATVRVHARTRAVPPIPPFPTGSNNVNARFEDVDARIHNLETSLKRLRTRKVRRP